MNTANDWINSLRLLPYMAGGFYKETAQSSQNFTDMSGKKRSIYTNYLFLLTEKEPLHFHLLPSDEIWYYHSGAPLTIHCIFSTGYYEEIKLGADIKNGEVFQYRIPAKTICAAHVASDFTIASRLIAPSDLANELTLFDQENLLAMYPEHETVILKYTKK